MVKDGLDVVEPEHFPFEFHTMIGSVRCPTSFVNVHWTSSTAVFGELTEHPKTICCPVIWLYDGCGIDVTGVGSEMIEKKTLTKTDHRFQDNI